MKAANENIGHGKDHEEKEKQVHIFVNRLKFDRGDGVKETMTPDEIAKLVGQTAECATVKWATGQHAGEEVTGPVQVKNGDHFLVTRKQVRGGFVNRIEEEIALLQEGGQEVALVDRYVIYRNIPTGCPKTPFTDVMVPVPNGYPASMLDRAALPANSPLIGRVPGSPQETVQVNGEPWRLISYHPHQGGGGKPWSPAHHGFHTYFSEVLAWLGVVK